MSSIHAVSSVFVGKKTYIDMLQNSSGEIAFMCRMKGVTQEVIAVTANEMFSDSIKCSYHDSLFFPDTLVTDKNEAYKCSVWLLYMKLYDGDAVSFDLCSGGNPCFNMNDDYTVSSKQSFIRVLQF